jgi:hypothetical protein
MKCDPEVMRSILYFAEEHRAPVRGMNRRVEIDGYDYATNVGHIELLIKDSYRDGRVVKGLGGPTGAEAVIIRVPNKGHDADCDRS